MSEVPAHHPPRLLLVTPVVPDPQGNGLSMRAAAFLDALAPDFSITLLVVAVAGHPREWPDFVIDRTADRACVPPRPREPGQSAGSAAPLRDAASLLSCMRPALTRVALSADIETAVAGTPPPHVVIILRLYLAPLLDRLARPVDGRVPFAVLDLDDDEVTTRERLAWLHAQRGHAGHATDEDDECQRYRVLESAWLRRFDRVCVCSEHDREVVSRRVGHTGVVVVPNAIAAIVPPAVRPGAGAETRLLFVGTLGYLPNVDAAEWLAWRVLPAVASRLQRPVRLDIVGRQPAPAVRALASEPGVYVHADVADTTPFYRSASVALAPMRAGGGTSIKVLEAFAHGVPTVATREGARGLGAIDGVHLLLGDSVEDVAEHCARLVEQPDLAGRLVASAYELLLARYSTDRVSPIIRAVVQDHAWAGGSA